jgi:hypothetical protein
MPGPADTPPETDEIHMESVVSPPWDEEGHGIKRLFGGSGQRDQAQPFAQPLNMNVHGENIATESKEKNAGGSFRADTVQAHKFSHYILARLRFQRRKVVGPVAVFYRPEDVAYRPGFLARHPPYPDS